MDEIQKLVNILLIDKKIGIVFVPSAVVYHVRGGAQGRTFFQRLPNTTWYVTNHITTLIKKL